MVILGIQHLHFLFQLQYQGLTAYVTFCCTMILTHVLIKLTLDSIVSDNSKCSFVNHAQTDVTLVENGMLMRNSYCISTRTTDFNDCIIWHIFELANLQWEQQRPIVRNVFKTSFDFIFIFNFLNVICLFHRHMISDRQTIETGNRIMGFKGCIVLLFWI